MNFLGQGFQGSEHKQDRQTDATDPTHYQPHSYVYLFMLVYPVLCCCNLDLDPITLTTNMTQIFSICTHTLKMKFLIGQGNQSTQQDRQTYRQDPIYYHSCICGR